jgi:GTPase SAR1 family protein
MSDPALSSSTTDRNVLRSSSPPRTLLKQEYTLKIIVIGELGAGKTALIQRYVKNTFTGQYRSTVC